MADCRARKKTRDKLAHGVVRHFKWANKKGPQSDTLFVPYGFKIQDVEPKNALAPFSPNFDPRPKSGMKLNDIKQASLSFFQLRHDLWDLSDRILAEKMHERHRETASDATESGAPPETPKNLNPEDSEPPPLPSQE